MNIKNPIMLKDSLHNCSTDCTRTGSFDGIEDLKPTQVYGQGIFLGIVGCLMAMGLDFDAALNTTMRHTPKDLDRNCIPKSWRSITPKPAPPHVSEECTTGKAIKLLREGADEIERNPFSMDSIMNNIDNFWGIETGRIEKEGEDPDNPEFY